MLGGWSSPSVEVAVREDYGFWVEKKADLCGQPVKKVSDPFGQTPGMMEKGFPKPLGLLFSPKIQPKESQRYQTHQPTETPPTAD